VIDHRGLVRVVVGGVLAAVTVLLLPPAAGAVVVDGFVTPAQAEAGEGWAIHADHTAGGSARLVEGPLTPPSSPGSLELSVATTADEALVFTVPKPGAAPTPPPGLGAITPTPWGNLNGSFSTFTANTTSPSAAIPVLRIVGYQQFNSVDSLLADGFTTLTFEGSDQASLAAANTWQTWTLVPDSRVWQSNQTDDPGFCPQATPCTLSEFVARYPDGAWGQVQVGLGAGAPSGAIGYVDNVRISDGTTTFVSDFDVPAAFNSTATIVTGPGGTVDSSAGFTFTITLNSSPLAALGSTDFTIVASPVGASPTTLALLTIRDTVTVPAGQSRTRTLRGPFNITDWVVFAHGVGLAQARVTMVFDLPPTATPPPTSSGTLPATGGRHNGELIGIAFTMIVLGGALMLSSPKRSQRAAGTNGS
jgi:hypothetical protein